MEEMLENYLLVAEAEGCERTEKGQKTISHKEIRDRYGLSEADLDAGDVEIE
jgi:hypothetical protein